MFGVVAVLVEVQVAVGVEHHVSDVQFGRHWLSVYPSGSVLVGYFVFAAVGVVVAVVCIYQIVIYIRLHIAVYGKMVEFGFRGGVGVGYMSFFLSHLRFVWCCKGTCFSSYFFLLKEKSNKKVQEQFFVLRFAIETATGSFFTFSPPRHRFFAKIVWLGLLPVGLQGLYVAYVFGIYGLIFLLEKKITTYKNKIPHK